MFTGDVDQVEAMIKNGVNINEYIIKSWLDPLQYAAGAGKLFY